MGKLIALPASSELDGNCGFKGRAKQDSHWAVEEKDEWRMLSELDRFIVQPLSPLPTSNPGRERQSLSSFEVQGDKGDRRKAQLGEMHCD